MAPKRIPEELLGAFWDFLGAFRELFGTPRVLFDSFVQTLACVAEFCIFRNCFCRFNRISGEL